MVLALDASWWFYLAIVLAWGVSVSAIEMQQPSGTEPDTPPQGQHRRMLARRSLIAVCLVVLATSWTTIYRAKTSPEAYAREQERIDQRLADEVRQRAEWEANAPARAAAEAAAKAAEEQKAAERAAAAEKERLARSEKEAAAEKERVASDLDAWAEVLAEQRVRRKLRDPNSAQLSNVKVYRNGALADRVVCGVVNAKNGFGAYVGDEGFIIRFTGMTKNGDGIATRQISDIIPTEASVNRNCIHRTR